MNYEASDERSSPGNAGLAKVRAGLKMQALPLSRIPAVLVLYAFALVCSFWLAYQVRFDFKVPTDESSKLVYFGLWIVPLKLIFLLLIGQFSGLLSYFSVPDLRRLLGGLALGSAFPALVWFQSGGLSAPPRGVIMADFFLSFLAISTIRLCCRLARERYFNYSKGRFNGRISRVGIVGAGYAGAALARELTIKSQLGLRPVMFFDDESGKWNSRVHDIPVVGSPELLLDSRRSGKLDKVIIAMPSAPAKRIGEVVRILQRVGLKFETIPTLDQLATGKVKVSNLRPVEIEDLLGRAPVRLETEDIRNILQDRVVMVTGAGGSIGSELCRQIVSFNPRQLLLVEQSEGQMFQVEQELIDMGYQRMVVPLMADILDMPRMHDIFERYQPHVVFHAAAHKHVPMMERHPCEAIKNNTLGTVCVATLAMEFKVDRFVLISTDKAINPTNVMGATKRLAEIFLQSLSGNHPSSTKFMAVRFGNVLGSSGSVIPIFKKQIAAGGPVKVTHPEITRYFMTIPEAVGLVLQCGAQGIGGEIFVLDMGKPVKIVDLARQLIELSGLKPDEDIEIEFVGLRPGEKLHEELSYKGENILPTNHSKIMRFISRPLPLDYIQKNLQTLFAKLQETDPNELKLMLKRIIPEYRPDFGQLAACPSEQPLRSSYQSSPPVSVTDDDRDDF